MKCEDLQTIYKLIFTTLSDIIYESAKKFAFIVNNEKIPTAYKEGAYFTTLSVMNATQEGGESVPILIAHFSEKLNSTWNLSSEELIKALVSASLAFNKKILWGMMADCYSLYLVRLDISKSTAKLSSFKLASFYELWPEQVSENWEDLFGLLMAIVLNSSDIKI